jgi:hypothetical protein
MKVYNGGETASPAGDVRLLPHQRRNCLQRSLLFRAQWPFAPLAIVSEELKTASCLAVFSHVSSMAWDLTISMSGPQRPIFNDLMWVERSEP